MGRYGERDMTGVTAIMAGASAGGPSFRLDVDTYSDNGIGAASVSWELVTNGTVAVEGTNFGQIDLYDWITPKPPAATYYIRVSPTSGGFSSGAAINTWLATTSNRAWVLDDGGSSQSVTFTAQLATDSGGTNVVASASIQLIATIL